MRDLFCLDTKDYNPDGKVIKRPSVRAVVAKEGKVLLVYSRKYDYYKFPGGGFKDGENPIEALCREVAEETGYLVLPDTCKEYGRVLRRNRDDYDENGIFEQENFYYFCEISDEMTATNLDDYEAEEEFTAVWMEPIAASRHNLHNRKNTGGDSVMVKREGLVLDMADAELRRMDRDRREAETVKSLAYVRDREENEAPDYADMLAYVESKLAQPGTERIGAKNSIAYSRYEHTRRVLGWAKRLYDGYDKKEAVRYEDLMIATIFHDIGRKRALETGGAHGPVGAPMTAEYLSTHGYERERIDYICNLVARHSDKKALREEGTDETLVLLMEADLLDDMGALGIVMDCMIVENQNPRAKFKDCLDHIMRYTQRLQRENPCVTEIGRKLWDEKTKLVDAFVEALQQDVELI